MELTAEYWFMFPVAIMVSTIAMSTGVGGAVFFSPIYILILGLDPSVAIGTALTTQLFGVSSGFYAYAKAGLIDYRLGKSLLIYSIPFAILGSMISSYINSDLLKAIFAIGIIFIGIQLFRSWQEKRKSKTASDQQNQFDYTLTDKAGKNYQYNIVQPMLGKLFAAIGGGFLGMISVGLAELQEYHLVVRSKVPLVIAVATSIFVASLTVMVASAGHFYNFLVNSSAETLNTVLKVIIFSIPGVLIGGQIGPRIQKHFSPAGLKLFISALFFFIGFSLIFSLIWQ
ncbi:MAG: sulfite exporter TauE/SafE family protein [Bacteroidota bacterium]